MALLDFARLTGKRESLRIDAADMVYSDTKDPYFRDCFYKGM
jgi:hypothetical protein